MATFYKYEVVCEDVPKELRDVAKSLECDISEIDFDILEVVTYKKESERGEFELVESFETDRFLDKDFLLNPELQIKQQYKILLKPTKEKPYKISMQFSANKSLSKVAVVIKKDSVLPRHSDLKAILKEEIDKKKLKLKLLVNICDKELKKGLNSVVTAVKSFGSIKQDISITVCECVVPVESIKPKVIELFKEKKRDIDDKEKVDHRNRGIFSHIKEGDAAIKFIKGKPGKPGRSCRGVYIEVDDIDEVQRPDFKIDDTLQERSTADEIVYYATKSGFLKNEDNTYKISEDLQVDVVGLRETGNITSDKLEKSKVEVKGGAYGEDSISANMVVKSKEVSVEGSVGSNAVVEAEVVNINSQTHKNSKIVADKISIKRHKGSAYGKKVVIDILEGGYVEGDEVVVINALGGEIRGGDIKIQSCSSHTKVYATTSIVVEVLKGEGNSFVIDGAAFGGLREKQKSIEIEIKDSIQEIKKFEDRKKYLADFIKNNRESIRSVKEFIREARKRDTDPSNVLIRRLQDYNKVISEVKDLDAKICGINEDIKIKKLEYETIEQKVYGAKIEILEGEKSGCAVGFVINHERHKKLSYVPKNHENLFTLKEVDGEYAINAL